MSTDVLFKELEPPGGGPERFAQRLDEIANERAAPPARVLATAAAAAAVVLVAALLLLREPNDTRPALVDEPALVDVYNAPELDRLLGRSAPPTELMVMVNMEAADVTEIQTTNQKVRVYHIN
jgi:hypothetical protein